MKVLKKAHQTSKEINDKNHTGDQNRELNPDIRLFTAKTMGRIRFDKFDHAQWLRRQHQQDCTTA